MTYYDFPLLVYRNQPVEAAVYDGYIWIKVRDGRKLALPVSMFDWLAQAQPQQQQVIELTETSVFWPQLDEGISMATFLGWYSPTTDLVSPEDMAKLHGIAPNTIYRILRSEENLDDAARRIPRAFYRGEGQRRTWYIPREVAEAFVPDSRGRKVKAD
ncbi:MAG: DUF2442 domain-containing protein [Chloroflexi bacterium]|nr:DUF2442 domain-containing protein [Chloroflexota bacterium]